MTLLQPRNLRDTLRVAVAALLSVSCVSFGQNNDFGRALIACSGRAGAKQALDKVNVYLTTKPEDAVGRFIRGLAQFWSWAIRTTRS